MVVKLSGHQQESGNCTSKHLGRSTMATTVPLKERITQFINEHGKQWKKLSTTLTKEGYEGLTPNLLRKRWGRWEAKKEREEQDRRNREWEEQKKRERTERSEEFVQPQPELLHGQGVDMAELIAQALDRPMPDRWISEVEDIVEEIVKPIMQRTAEETSRQVFQNMRQTVEHPLGEMEEPPEPRRVPGTRRETREWDRISATIDKNVMKLFNQEKKLRRMSTSRLLETVLWLYFGKPRLSYQED
ncbi:hypothetical protein ACFL2Q_05145 [Thermodesulfobacteriota bacterium]